MKKRLANVVIYTKEQSFSIKERNVMADQVLVFVYRRHDEFAGEQANGGECAVGEKGNGGEGINGCVNVRKSF